MGKDPFFFLSSDQISFSVSAKPERKSMTKAETPSQSLKRSGREAQRKPKEIKGSEGKAKAKADTMTRQRQRAKVRKEKLLEAARPRMLLKNLLKRRLEGVVEEVAVAAQRKRREK